MESINIVAIHSSNRSHGLTGSMVGALLEGAEKAATALEIDLSTEVVALNSLNIQVCKACGDRGWGPCRAGEPCVIDDDFRPLLEELVKADALVFATPVYFHDLSESMKGFLDRLRRSEWVRIDNPRLVGKHVVGIAAAGGGGGGTPRTIEVLERYMSYFGVINVAWLGVWKINSEVQLKAAYMTGEHLIKVIAGAKGVNHPLP